MATAVGAPARAWRRAVSSLAESARQAARCPRALWGVHLSYLVEGIVYFGLLTVLGKFCAENIGLSDLHAGWIYSGVTGGITLAMLLLGGVCDAMGLRRGLVLSLALMAAGYGVIAMAGAFPRGLGLGSTPFVVLLAGLFVVVVGFGIYKPAVYAGVKRYARPEDAAMAYAVVYGMVNLGSFLTGVISPLVRQRFAAAAPPNGLTAVFWAYCALAVGAIILTLVLMTGRADRAAAAEGQEAASAGSAVDPDRLPPARPNNTATIVWSLLALLAAAAFFAGVRAAPALGAAGLCLGLAGWAYLKRRPDHPFRDGRFVAFIFILIPVQTLLAHQWLTVPYYCDRAFHGTDVSRYFEFFSNLNPLVIFVVAPVVAALTARTGVYKMMIVGTLVMALPSFLLGVGPNTPLFLAYVLLMSIGEAIWQPRFLQWVAEIAPPGKAGLYMGIGQFPWFLTKLVTGLYSGYFIEHYCPRPELGLPMRTGEMWVIYGLIAIVSPVALVAGRRWMGRGPDGREM